jgi:hypothetical protein
LLVELLHEAGDFQEIIAIIGIAHDDIFPFCGGDAALESTAVAFFRNMAPGVPMRSAIFYSPIAFTPSPPKFIASVASPAIFNFI